jgi:hypothetical protein
VAAWLAVTLSTLSELEDPPVLSVIATPTAAMATAAAITLAISAGP